ncbi:hypothetical protein SS1G_06907 [Sclerotinia sclerotiorum 1980 UF-70]|uniref:Zn(2)-C6 fungal-type domain-containing protein n=2 Tax=Sclerotinia sclerotiorum (strain ATCC 18683 / 1980 / Ss-1) TaxID=665079 RepID=A7ENK8_SCLS1|nr:hypothetical protein SS1G_06907 [Sclerotinia sclerotiorum 1980 UF-70]APA14856.1 hypothetical protein sscle_13g096260 [Sclerotinia sclerotiorum 1980 UF-70]EDO04424.1 hypothetical protein SS1G_06907 [Sclerotinia sclerotiorum 1980 UF-70]
MALPSTSVIPISPKRDSRTSFMDSKPDKSMRLPASECGPRPVKRGRASKPKVKSGCITCKARRVKCDETKPQCLRCRKFGRTCDGYAHETPSRGIMMPLQPRIPTTDLYTPSISLEATEDEGRYFRYFCDQTAYQLPGYFDPTFWKHIILQESHNVTPIRHAVIAIGALNKAIEEAPRPNLKVNVIQDINKKHHEFAVLQHLKAIQALSQYISSSNGPQLRTALMACLLFVCFETIQGSYASSVQQTYGGLKLLRSYYAGKPGSKPWIPRRISAGLNTKPQIDKIIAKVHSRPGMDSSSKSATISSHIEEYLESEKPSLQSAHTPTIDRIPTPPQRDYSPRLDEIAISAHYKSNLTLEQQRSLSGTPTQDYPSAYHTPSEYVSPNEHQSSNIVMPIALNGRGPSSNGSTSMLRTPESIHTPPSMGNTPPPTTYISSQSPPILNNPRKRPLQSRTPTPPILNNDFTLEENIIQAFVRLDGQGLFFGMTPGIPPLVWDIHAAHHIPIPKVFTSFSEAQHCWDFLMDRTLQYYRRTLFDRKFASAKSDTADEIAQQYAEYVAGLNEFEQAFQPILSSSISPEGKVLNQAAIVLMTHLKATAITLSAVTSTSEMIYDSFMNDFQYIVQAAEKLVTTFEPNPSAINSSRFSFDIGIVPPLHVVATKCREPNIRRKALDLLFRTPRQEGMWDGVLSARIGLWICGCEEDGLDVPRRLEANAQSDYSNQRSQQREPIQSYNGRLSPEYFNYIETNSNGDIIQEGFSPYSSQSQSPIHRTPSPYTQARTPPIRDHFPLIQQENLWVIPEEKRFQLVIVDFHIPERYIMVKCKRSVPSKDGTREGRETIIAW